MTVRAAVYRGELLAPRSLALPMVRQPSRDVRDPSPGSVHRATGAGSSVACGRDRGHPPPPRLRPPWAGRPLFRTGRTPPVDMVLPLVWLASIAPLDWYPVGECDEPTSNADRRCMSTGPATSHRLPMPSSAPGTRICSAATWANGPGWSTTPTCSTPRQRDRRRRLHPGRGAGRAGARGGRAEPRRTPPRDAPICWRG